jgi:hypothetical protein
VPDAGVAVPKVFRLHLEFRILDVIGPRVDEEVVDAVRCPQRKRAAIGRDPFLPRAVDVDSDFCQFWQPRIAVAEPCAFEKVGLLRRRVALVERLETAGIDLAERHRRGLDAEFRRQRFANREAERVVLLSEGRQTNDLPPCGRRRVGLSRSGLTFGRDRFRVCSKGECYAI